MMPRRINPQWCVLLVLLFLLSLALAGCGPGIRTGTEEGLKRLDEIPTPRRFNNEPFDIPSQTVPRQRPKSFEQIVDDLARAAQQRAQQRARETLVELYGGDLYDKALAQALCGGMEQLSQYSDEDVRFTQEGWEGYLKEAGTEYAKDIAKEYGYQYIDRTAMLNKVDGLLAGWDIAQESPQTARIYVRACVLQR
jgi:hypothetical protein